MKTFAVLQLSGCAGCEMSLLEAEDWTQQYKLAHLPLVISSHDIPHVEVLLISSGVRTDEDLFNLRRSVKKAKQVVAVGWDLLCSALYPDCLLLLIRRRSDRPW